TARGPAAIGSLPRSLHRSLQLRAHLLREPGPEGRESGYQPNRGRVARLRAITTARSAIYPLSSQRRSPNLPESLETMPANKRNINHGSETGGNGWRLNHGATVMRRGRRRGVADNRLPHSDYRYHRAQARRRSVARERSAV